MKVFNEAILLNNNNKNIINLILENYKKSRNFNTKNYIDKKIQILDKYFKEYNLDTAVVALSGGIDSAIVFALLNEMKSRKGSVLKKIIPITLPAINNKGVSRQESSLKRVEELLGYHHYDLLSYDLSDDSNNIIYNIDDMLNLKSKNWAKGQFVPYLRTSVLYYITNLLNENNDRAVLVGTTNADEGQYLGYIGKASDAMVDLQPISDLHKSEVYKVAEYFKLPKSIIEIPPTGDMFDERTDEEVFGTSYDHVEFYYAYLKCSENKKKEIKSIIENNGALDLFNSIEYNLENLHNYNKHKYLGCSPSVHFDLFPMKIKGGWKYFNYK